MRRMAFIAGAALPGILLVTLLSCSSDLGEETGNRTGNGSGPTASAGRHSTLPEPCAAVDGELLAALLPGATEEELTGVPEATFNTARRVGCVWEVRGEQGTHRLRVDFLRVVSYDPEVSDEEQAERDFAAAAEAAGLDLRADPEDAEGPDGVEGDADPGQEGPDGSPSPEADAEDTDGDGDGEETDDAPDADATETDGADTPESEEGTDSDSDESDAETGAGDADGEVGEAGTDDGEDGTNGDGDSPRVVENTGEESWLDDRLTSDADGGLREIVVTFRTSNAIVTVTRAEDFGPGGALPRDPEARDLTVELARRLAVRFEE
ncbi:hypothetical protein [Streptomyces sp. ST2-7A]|uniref:hypothetical protein n=1 Tax=Streptomyces sp. ST2-7A TaxID=2907214 RepID=UPI001F42721B|nr:hypothetical protein [Streptomyces sp. ST2-7A]MCE7080304.1 hypothetical protein [Streptomyces sp. ST2-7A]